MPLRSMPFGVLGVVLDVNTETDSCASNTFTLRHLRSPGNLQCLRCRFLGSPLHLNGHVKGAAAFHTCRHSIVREHGRNTFWGACNDHVAFL